MLFFKLSTLPSAYLLLFCTEKEKKHQGYEVETWESLKAGLESRIHLRAT